MGGDPEWKRDTDHTICLMAGETYQYLFNPTNRSGVQDVSHDGGNPVFRNYWFRGWCNTHCPAKTSHTKQLSLVESTRLKKFIGQLRTKASNNKKQQYVPYQLPSYPNHAQFGAEIPAGIPPPPPLPEASVQLNPSPAQVPYAGNYQPSRTY